MAYSQALWRRSTTPKKEASNTSLAEKVLANAKEAEKKQSEKKTEKKAGWTLCCCPPKTMGDICVFVPNEILFPLNAHTVDGSEIRLTSWYGKYPIIYRFFFTSQVVIAGFLNHQQ